MNENLTPEGRACKVVHGTLAVRTLSTVERDTLKERITTAISAATTEAREAERAEIVLMLETGRDIGHEVCALQFAQRIRARAENKS